MYVYRLAVLLNIADRLALSQASIRLQQTFLDNDYVFQINYQSGSFSQFFVEANCCAEHLEKALQKLDFNVEVNELEPQATTKEYCHDCQTTSVAQ